MPLYKEDSFLVVCPGSQYTIFTFGFSDSLAPPQFRVPTVVYQDKANGEFHATKEAGTDLTEIYPIQKGKIINLDAFNHFLKIVLQSVLQKNPILTINHIPLLLITPSLTWSRTQVEHITKYVVESLEFTAFNILDFAVASTFGVGSNTTSATVVKVGYQQTQIVPVVSYQAVKYAAAYLPEIGSNSLNEELQKILPNYTTQQIEDLKVSGIYEVLSSLDDTSFYSYADLQSNDDSEMDVAKLVAEGKVDEGDDEVKVNRDLETNTFVDSVSGENVSVGKERFQGATKFINTIASHIYNTLSKVHDIEKRQECYDNLIFVGSTFQIPGLKEAILHKLLADYLFREPSHNTGSTSNGVNTAILAYQQANESLNDGEHNSSIAQVPSSIKISKFPEYFPEWKKPKERGGSWHHVHFLGGEIFAKQIFSNNSNHGRALFVDSDVYEERGPESIWVASV